MQEIWKILLLFFLFCCVDVALRYTYGRFIIFVSVPKMPHLQNCMFDWTNTPFSKVAAALSANILTVTLGQKCQIDFKIMLNIYASTEVCILKSTCVDIFLGNHVTTTTHICVTWCVYLRAKNQICVHFYVNEKHDPCVKENFTESDT